MQKQADWLARYARYKIKIEGFADDRGTPDTNKAAGVNVPAGSNEDFIVNVGRRIYFDEGSAEINDVAPTGAPVASMTGFSVTQAARRPSATKAYWMGDTIPSGLGWPR